MEVRHWGSSGGSRAAAARTTRNLEYEYPKEEVLKTLTGVFLLEMQHENIGGLQISVFVECRDGHETSR